MFLFHDEVLNARYLHTGDFRYDGMKLPSFCFPITTVYLDTTYCKPSYTFPPQQVTIENACKLAKKYAMKDSTLVLFGTYSIGKERLFTAVVECLGKEKIVVSNAKLQILKVSKIRSIPRFTT